MEHIAFVFFNLCLLGCGIQDLRCQRIPNHWILAGGVAGSYFYGGRFWLSVLLFLLAGYWLYYFRMIGAGDLKMMALICGFIGLSRGICAIGISLCICGGVSLLIIICRKEWKNQLIYRRHHFFAWLGQTVQTKTRIAYYDKGRDDKVVSIPLGAYLCLGTMCYLVYCSQRGVL